MERALYYLTAPGVWLLGFLARSAFDLIHLTEEESRTIRWTAAPFALALVTLSALAGLMVAIYSVALALPWVVINIMLLAPAKAAAEMATGDEPTHLRGIITAFEAYRRARDGLLEEN